MVFLTLDVLLDLSLAGLLVHEAHDDPVGELPVLHARVHHRVLHGKRQKKGTFSKKKSRQFISPVLFCQYKYSRQFSFIESKSIILSRNLPINICGQGPHSKTTYKIATSNFMWKRAKHAQIIRQSTSGDCGLRLLEQGE